MICPSCGTDTIPQWTTCPSCAGTAPEPSPPEPRVSGRFELALAAALCLYGAEMMRLIVVEFTSDVMVATFLTKAPDYVLPFVAAVLLSQRRFALIGAGLAFGAMAGKLATPAFAAGTSDWVEPPPLPVWAAVLPPLLAVAALYAARGHLELLATWRNAALAGVTALVNVVWYAGLLRPWTSYLTDNGRYECCTMFYLPNQRWWDVAITATCVSVLVLTCLASFAKSSRLKAAVFTGVWTAALAEILLSSIFPATPWFSYGVGSPDGRLPGFWISASAVAAFCALSMLLLRAAGAAVRGTGVDPVGVRRSD